MPAEVGDTLLETSIQYPETDQTGCWKREGCSRVSPMEVLASSEVGEHYTLEVNYFEVK